MVGARFVRGVSALGVAVAVWAAWTPGGAADSIRFKDGKVIDAPIKEQTSQKIVVDWYGVPVTYWMRDIERIDPAGRSAGASEPIVTRSEGVQAGIEEFLRGEYTRAAGLLTPYAEL